MSDERDRLFRPILNLLSKPKSSFVNLIFARGNISAMGLCKVRSQISLILSEANLKLLSITRQKEKCPLSYELH